MRFIIKNLMKLKSANLDVVGKLWISFGILFLNLYIPCISWDPAEIRFQKIKSLGSKIDFENAGLIVRQEYLFLLSGNQENIELKELETELSRLKQKKSNLALKMPIRPKISQMDEIFEELKRLKNHILSDAVLDLANDIMICGDQAETKEKTFQDILDSIIEKFQVKYHFYQDILQPAIESIFQIKYGLKLCLTEAKKISKTLEICVISHALNFSKRINLQTFVDAYNNVKRIQPSTSEIMNVKLDLIIAILEEIICLQSIGLNSDAEGKLFVCEIFSSVVDLWEIQQEQIKEKERQDSSLYKVKSYKFETEEEIDEMDVKKLFPDFKIDYADIENDIAYLKSSHKLSDSSVSSVITNLFFRFVEALENSAGNMATFGRSWKAAYHRSFNAAISYINLKDLKIDREIDSIGHNGFLVITNEHLNSFQKEYQNANIYDFYNDEDVQEICKAKNVLNNYSMKLEKCLSQWPEHSVLLNLKAICHRIISFSITSPVMKLLTGLDMLLARSEDWQKYASREYSLKDSLDEIVKLIVSWRKKELNSWNQLLALERIKCQDNISDLWFHLWRTIYQGVFSKIQLTIPEDEFANEILFLLDRFCLEASIGDFEARLVTLRAFHSLISSLPAGNYSDRIRNISWNVYSFYNQYLDVVKSKLANTENIVSKELKEYVKIASWKDVNVYALKESARRTHYQLLKFVKKYRSELSFKVKEIILSSHENVSVISNSSFLNMNQIIERLRQSIIFSHQKYDYKITTGTPNLIKINTIIEKSAQMIVDICKEENLLKSSGNIEEMNEVILDRIKSYQTNKVDIKAIKGQKNIRKKAWNDLLKHLSYMGLSSRCSHKFIFQQDSLYIYSLPEILTSNICSVFHKFAKMDYDIDTFCSKSNDYFQRILGRIGALRKLSMNFTPEITRNEVEKAISFLDNLLHILIKERECLSKYSNDVGSLCDVLDQLRFCTSKSNGKMDVQIFNNHQVALSHTAINSLYASIVQSSLVISSSDSDGMIKEFISSFEEMFLRCKNEFNTFENTNFTHISTCALTKCLENSFKLISKLIQDLSDFKDKFPEKFFFFDCLFSEATNYQRLLNMESKPSAGCTFDQFTLSLDRSVKMMLLCIQHFRKTSEDHETSVDEFGISPQEIINSHKRISYYLSSNHIMNLNGEISHTFNSISLLEESSARDGINALLSVFPVAENCLRIIQLRLIEFLTFHKVFSI